MRLIATGILIGGLAATTSAPAQAQGGWQPQANPSPPPPVYVATPAPPPAPRPTKARPAMPAENPGSWVTQEDYPPEAMRAEQQGTTGFRLEIDPTGKVTRCDVTASSGSQLLDDTACRLMAERGKFTPALDAKGKPTTGSYSNRFRWVIPEPQLIAAPQPFTDTLTFIVEPDGSATECAKSGNGSPMANDKLPCGYGQVFAPYLDASGKPVRRKVTMHVELTVVDPAAPPPPVAAPAPSPPKPKRRKP